MYQYCMYITNISPIYHKSQGHISVIWIWEKCEKFRPPPTSQRSLHLKCRLFWFWRYGLFPQFVTFFVWKAPLSQVWLARSLNVQLVYFRHFGSNHLWLLWIRSVCSCEVCAKNFRPFQSVIDSLVHDALKELDLLKILASIKYLLESCLPMKCIFCRINNLIHVFNYVNNEISNNYG